jgi:hypothetical protein
VLVLGGESNDVFYGATVFARFEGGSGNDEYHLSFFTNGIYDYDPTPGNVDTVFLPGGELLPGLQATAATFAVSRDGNDLVIGFDPPQLPAEYQDAADFMIFSVEDWFLGSEYRIERFVFEADGSEWTPGHIDEMLALQETYLPPPTADPGSGGGAPAAGVHLVGTDGADGLVGTAYDDVLEGGRGDDIQIGAEGNDTYRFDLGWGRDLVVDYGGGTNTLQFGPGIAAADLSAAWRDSRLVLARAGSTDEVAIEWAPADGYRAERAEFADGSVWDADRLDAMVAASQLASLPLPVDAPSAVPVVDAAGSAPPESAPTAPDTTSMDAAESEVAAAPGAAAPAMPTQAFAAAAALEIADPLPAVPAELERLAAQFFAHIQPPPLEPQAWIDTWPAPREANAGRAERQREAGAMAGPSPESREANTFDAPVNPEMQGEERALMPEEIRSYSTAMHAWYDVHQPFGGAGDAEFGTVPGAFMGLAPLGYGIAGGMFGVAPGVALPGVPALLPLQGLREGFSPLAWS